MKIKNPSADVGVIVGRFCVDVLHDAHKDLIKTVVSLHPRVVIFLGLASIRDKNNPLDFESRKQMIQEEFPEITILYISDMEDDKEWSLKLDKQIKEIIGPTQTAILYGSRNSFLNHYFGRFPKRELEPESVISATEIRNRIKTEVRKNRDFRAGAIWYSQNQYDLVLPTVDCAVLNEDKTKIILVRKCGEKRFRFVGGFSEVSSLSYEQDCQREVSEECGVEIGDITYLGSCLIDDWRYRKSNNKIKTLLFCAKYIHGPISIIDSQEIAEAKWFDINSVTPDNLVSFHLPLLDIVVKKISS